MQSCKQDPYLPPPIYNGEARAIKEGKPWNAWIYAKPRRLYPQHGFYLSMDVYNTNLYLREGLTFFSIPYSTGTYTVDTISIYSDTALTGASYGTYIDDGDVLSQLYDVIHDLGHDNYIRITSYNTQTGEIHGEFQVTVATKSPPLDTLHFTEGYFHTWIK